MSDAASRKPGATVVSAETDLDEDSLNVRLAGGPGPVDPADVVAADAAAREFVARHEQATHRPQGEEIGRALQGELPVDAITPRTAPAAMIHGLAAQHGGGIQYQLQDNALILGAIVREA